MHFTWNRRTLLIGFAATLVGVGLLAAPFRIVGTTQSNQEAAVGARLMRGAVDLHYHVDPGYGRYENLAQAKAAGVRALLLKNQTSRQRRSSCCCDRSSRASSCMPGSSSTGPTVV